MRYALVDAQGVIVKSSDEYRKFDLSLAHTKPSYRWLPYVETEPPQHVRDLETVAFTYAVDGDDVVRRWAVTRRPIHEQVAAIKAECQRRIVALTGAVDIINCIIKQSNANMRANELNDKRINGGTLTEAEAGEAVALRNLAVGIKALRARSNGIEALGEIPLDYNADARWA